MKSPLSSLALDPRAGVGIAEQIRSRVAVLVADSELSPGDQLPPVRELARQLGVNVNTVRSAYAKLEADGLVQTRHGVGTLVLPAGVEDLPVTGARPLGTNTVAVLIGGLDPFDLALLRGVGDVAAEEGALVVIADTRDSPTLAEAVIRRLIARGVDGIIAVSVGRIPVARGRKRTSRTGVPPIVHVDQPDRSGYSLIFDGRRAGYLATQHLQGHGHDRVGIVTAPLTWPNVKDLYDGYVQARDEQDVPALTSEVEEFAIAAGRVGLARLLDLPEPPTAVFAAGETLALGVLKEARALGLSVPGDLAIVGYVDSPAAALVDPALTMVSVPAREIGMQAMRTLSELMRGKKPRPRRSVLDVELVVRDSCGSH